LLAAVRANPEDDSPRLVCADWLEENGDPDRARFIRAQCELARLPARDRRRQELFWLADGLEARCGNHWRAELPALEGVTWADFERGFVSTVRVKEPQPLYRHDAPIAAAAPVYRAELPAFNETNVPRPKGSVPWLRTLRLVCSDEFTPHRGQSLIGGLSGLELIDCPTYGDFGWLPASARQMPLTSLKIGGEYVTSEAFARTLADAAADWQLTTLELGTSFVDYNSGYFDDPTIGAGGARALAGARRLASLTALNLGRQRIGTVGLGEILASPHLRGVRELELRSNDIVSVEPFRWSEGGALTRLDLSDNAIGDRGVETLARSRGLADLACLDLDTCEITEVGIQSLTSAPFWPKLCRLDLSRNPLGWQGVEALMRAEPPARLYDLRLADCDLGSSESHAFTQSPWLAGLQCLDLSGNRAGSAGVIAREFVTKGNLRSLSLAQTDIEPRAIAGLAPLWGQLVSLDLSHNDIGSAFGQMAATDTARNLQTLRLKNCGESGGNALEALSRESVCPSLHTLVLANTVLDAPGLNALLHSSTLAGQLIELDLSRCDLSDQAARLLAGAPALAGVRRLNLRGNPFSEEALVALARSEHLRSVPEIVLSGTPWAYSAESQRVLAARFGPHWAYHRDDDPEEVDE
jgi:uncharacterized protein (TIGR02996 family)